jgi:transmembrane sensor
MIENEFNNAPYELIINGLDGILSVEEQQELTYWRSLSPANEELYQKISLVADHIELLTIYQNLNPDASWNKFRPLLEGEEEAPRIIPFRPEHKTSYADKLKWILPIAASFLLIFWFSIHQFSSKNKLMVVSTALHQHKMIALSDGTKVLLNENTKVSYDEYSYDQKRTFNLVEGEAFFDVIHNAEKPFKVKIDNIEVKDIGTSFNIRKEKQAVVVVVNSGIVSLANQTNGDKTTLKANQQGIYNLASNNIASITNDEINYKAWTDKNLQFIKTPLSNVAKELEDTYGIQIRLEDHSLNSKTLTASFSNQPIDSVLNAIGLTLRMKIEKRDNIFHLRKDSL